MKRSILYILAAILLTYVVRELEYFGIRKSKQGKFEKLNTCFNKKNNFDLLIIGSSRAESHFRPDIIDSTTGLNSYNAGMVGATFPFIEGTLEAYLENSSAPKYVVLNIDYHMFVASDDSIRYFPSYFPFLSNEALYSKFSERDKRFIAFKWIPFYSMPYFGTKYLNNSLRGFFDIPGKYDSTYIKGYTPIPIADPKDMDTVSIKPYRPWLKNTSWKSLQNIISLCRSKNIKLILVISPLYHRLSEAILNENEIIQNLESIAKKENCVFMNLVHLPITFEKNRFSDLDHLNRLGALEFSRIFAHDLTQYIKP